MILATNLATILGVLLSGLLVMLFCGTRWMRKILYLSLLCSFIWLVVFDIRFYTGDDACVVGAPIKAFVNRVIIDVGMLCAIIDGWRHPDDSPA